MTFSDVGWMLHLVMPSMSDGRRPASSSARSAASSAVTSSGRPMFFENGSWPMPTMAARSRRDTASRSHLRATEGRGRDTLLVAQAPAPARGYQLGGALAGLARPSGAVAGVVLDRLADRFERAAHERRAVLRRPVAAGREPGQRALELGHRVAREELVGAECRLAVGPLVRHEQVGAEAARLVCQARDLRRRVARRAYHGEAAGVERVDHLADVVDLADERQCGDPLEVVDPRREPEGDVA